jgi:disulfide bond formation protein DsbB
MHLHAAIGVQVMKGPAHHMANISRWVDRLSLYIALAAAWTAMLGSLYFSEVKAYVPCDLCWYQRILMYPLTLILAVGITVRDKWIPRIVLPLSVIGMGVSSYHYLLEKTDLFPKDTFCRAGASCVTVWINWFGFVTIPFLAFSAFTIITIMCVVAILAGEPRQTDEVYGDDAGEGGGEDEDDDSDPSLERAWPDRPWIPVLGVITVVVAIFAYLFMTGWQERARADALVASMESTMTVSEVSGDMSTATEPLAAGEGAIENGRALYALHCASCHGPNAEGVQSLGTALAPENQFVLEHTDAEVIQMIQQGRDLTSPENTSGLVMPPNGGAPNLTESDLQAIIAYLRSVE